MKSKYQSINVVVQNYEPNTTKNDYLVVSDHESVDAEEKFLLKPSNNCGRSSLKLPSPISVYILLGTLFFGFAFGFSIGFYAFRSYVHDGSCGYAASRSSTTADYMGNVVMDIKEKKAVDYLRRIFFDDKPPKFALSEETPALLKLSFQSAPRQLVYLNRPDAYELLLDSLTMSSTISRYSNDFFLISSGLDTQINQAYCGTATAVAILNSLRYLRSVNVDDGVDIPIDEVYSPYPYATQTDIFDNCTETTVVSHTGGGVGVDGILTPPFGLNMGQIADLLRCHLKSTPDTGGGSWSVKINYADRTHMTVGKVKYNLKNALEDPSSRVMVNYDRSMVGQAGGGHWSPVGSYSEKRDAFLILDVAKYKYPPVWIPTERLFDAMATYDDCGSWDYPSAQDKLTADERKVSSEEKYKSTFKKLDCEKELRGYIIVTRQT